MLLIKCTLLTEHLYKSRGFDSSDPSRATCQTLQGSVSVLDVKVCDGTITERLPPKFLHSNARES